MMKPPVRSKSPALERVKAQTEVLLPVLKALTAELGKERAEQLIFLALRESSRERFRRAAARRTGSGRQKWRDLTDTLDDVIGDAVDREELCDDDSAFDYNVTGCQFAQYFHGLGEPGLGAVLTCDVDHHVVEVSGEEVELDRPQTIMTGASHCKFRYRFRDTGSQS